MVDLTTNFLFESRVIVEQRTAGVVKTLVSKNRLLISTVLSVLLCFSLVVSVNAETEMWGQTYGDTGEQKAYSLVETSDGGYAIAGYTSSSANNHDDFWLVKTDMHGNMEWNQTYGGTGHEIACSLVETSDGGYAIAGLTEPYDSYKPRASDGWLVKTDTSGNMEWNVTYGGVGSDAFRSLVETSDGGFVMAGIWNCPLDGFWFWNTEFFSYGGDGWLVKVDASGNVEWNMTYGDENNDWASFYSVVEVSEGGYAVAGRNDDMDSWLVKVDVDGNMEWNKTYENFDPLWAFYSVVETSDGGYALSGSDGSFWLVKTNSSGDMEWEQRYWHDGNDEELAFSVVEASDGGYVMAGICEYYQNNEIGYLDFRGSFWIVKADEYGVMEWNQTYGSLGPDDYAWAYSVVATSDGGYAVAGVIFTGEPTSMYDFWLIKTDENGVAPVVPEAPWVVLPLLVTATLAIFIGKKKLRLQH